MREAGPGRGKTEKKLGGLPSFLTKLGLTKQTALEAQRIGELPENDLPRYSPNCGF